MSRMRICEWDHCQTRTPTEMIRCSEHRDMKWWEEYIEHLQHACYNEELPLDEYDDALSIVYESREAGGPKKAVLRLEKEHGLNPENFGDRWKDL